MLRSVRRAAATTFVWVVAVLVGGLGAPVTSWAVSLPDMRAYELVTPPAGKNGGNVMTNSQRFRVAADGSAVGFASLTAFGDVAGTGIATDYLSVRTATPGTNGWTTHAITPPQQPLSIDGIVNRGDPLYVGDYSPDAGKGVFSAWSPLTDDPNVADTANLYVRDDLRRPGSGTYQLLTACPLCAALSTPLPPFVDSNSVPAYGDASADFSSIAFESRANLTSDAPAQPAGCVNGSNTFSCLPRVYEWHDGQLLLAGQVPSSTSATSCGGTDPPCVPALASRGGNGFGTYPAHVVSQDGSRLFFSVPSNGGPERGRVFMRLANGATVEVSASERTDCAGDPNCGENGVPDPAPVSFATKRYWGAAVDGSRVVFSTSEALTDDAPVDGDRKLYVYDATKPPSDPHNLMLINVDREPADVSNDVQGVIAISEDAHYVYFLSSGQLVAGQPLPDISGIYMWHDGEIAYIGQSLYDETSELLIGGTARVSPDGRSLLFTSHNGGGFAVGYDHGSCQTRIGVGCRELYVYSAGSQTLVCASCRPDGGPASADAATTLVTNASASRTTWHLNHALSDDGTRVFFTSGESLLPADTNGKLDVYQYDVATGQLHLISSGTDPFDSYFMDASPDGHDVFFVTHERLVGWDTDESYDLYDARVGGGFPDPVPPAAGCSGAACHGAPGLTPVAPRVGSSTFDGAGNAAGVLKRRVVKCKKGFVRRRIRGKRRCVKRKHRHAKHAAKRAATQQRRTK